MLSTTTTLESEAEGFVAKKKKKAKKVVQLSPEEIREAKAMQKKTAKKLQQLEARAAQKKRRAELYKTLEKHQVSKSTLSLLSSSGSVSRKDTSTKKQTLQKLLNKERAGIALNNEEKALLYPEIVVEEEACDQQQKVQTAKADLQRNEDISNKNKPKKAKKAKSQERKYRVLDTKADPPTDSKDDEGQPMDLDNPKEEPKKEKESSTTGFDFAAQMWLLCQSLRKKLP